MTTATPEKTETVDAQQKVQKLRDLFANAPEMGRTALEKVLGELRQRPQTSAPPVGSAGRIGIRQGKVSELTVIAPFAPGGLQRLRALLDLLKGNFDGADKVGTVHDMRFVFLDNDTKVLFATAFDGDWDPYIDDFATKIPDYMDVLFSACEGWPGIHSPAVKEWIVKHQIPAAGWYVATPNLTVSETRKLERVGKALDEFLDKVGGA